jgi:hypothetical protein
MSDTIRRKDLEHAHSSPVKVQVPQVIRVELLGCVLHNLHPFYLKLSRLVMVIEVV